MQKKKLDASIFLLAAICLIVLISIVVGYLYISQGLDTFSINKNENSVISLLLVLEYEKKPFATYATFINPDTKHAAIFDIPGNTGKIIKKLNKVDQIDVVYNEHNLGVFVDQVEELIGTDLRYTLVLKIDKLGKIVDLLDGVKILVPADIQIYDSENTMFFPSGWIDLDGDKTIQYLLYHDEDNELESSSLRCQRFVLAFLKRISEKSAYLKNNQVDHMLDSFIKTNMNNKMFFKLLDILKPVNINIVNKIIGSHKEISGRVLLIPSYDGALIKDIVRQTLKSLVYRTADKENIITVEILNGTNTPGLAGRTADLIRNFGYEIINIGNAEHNNYEQTEIISRISNEQEIKDFSEITRCDNVKLQDGNYMDNTQSHEYKADFTFIIGKDYNARPGR
ncbi:MAG: LCP family protein [Spirochaetaceae bacterium]|nr:LCP family protein [Spirochaetaceae bacterium]